MIKQSDANVLLGSSRLTDFKRFLIILLSLKAVSTKWEKEDREGERGREKGRC